MSEKELLSREREAYLTLLKDINTCLGRTWNNMSQVEIKEMLNAALGRSLEMWI